MASQTLRNLYRQARKAQVGWIVGESALSAWRAARILRQWDALECLGLVRLRDEWDEHYEWEGDGANPCPDEPAYGSIGEYRLPGEEPYTAFDDEVEWEHGDSVWGHVGYRDVLDWRENPYILDVMSETIAQFRAAWKHQVHRARCPMCSQPIPA
jgi:hypothetical protein